MKKLFVANYKMNGNKNFYQKVNKVVNKLKLKDTVILCPPFVYMPFLKIKNKNILLGSQDVSMTNNTKSTGQISPNMLKEFGVSYSIVGHSERKQNGETMEIIARKVELAQNCGIIPIVCVGENTKTSKIDVIEEQILESLKYAQKMEILIAYEPVWAIGTGEQPSVNKINKVIKIIKEVATKNHFENVKVLYGGSVNEKNYVQLLSSNVDGFLLGGISLELDKFLKIIRRENG